MECARKGSQGRRSGDDVHNAPKWMRARLSRPAPVDDVETIHKPLPADCRACTDDGTLIWPEDPDEVPPWRLALEAKAAAWGWDKLGIRLPGYRTRREAEQKEELCIINAAPIQILRPVASAWPVDMAAERFLAHLQRDDDLVGEYSAPELSVLYSEFCVAQNVTPRPVDQVKAALALRHGVQRSQVDRRVEGRRQRSIRWVISPTSIAAPDREAKIVEFRQAA